MSIRHNITFVLQAALLSSIFFTVGNCREFMRLCYYPSWSDSRPSPLATFRISDIDPTLCTHLVYAFGKIDHDSKLLVATSPSTEESNPEHVGKYEKFTNLKKDNYRLKTLLSVGGQNDNGEGFKIITENDVIVKRFAYEAVRFLRKRKFDGLDVDWEYPTKETRKNFVALLKSLREAFDSEDTGGQDRLLLTIAGPAGQYYIDPGFDIPNIARYVDYVNLMTYDYTTTTAPSTAFNSPLFSRSDPRFNSQLSTNWTVHYWHSRGMPFSKMLVGVTPVGVHLVLDNVNNTEVGSATTGDVRDGDIYVIPGRLAYPEICTMLTSTQTQRYFDYEQRVPYLVKGDEWVGYEDKESLAVKVPWMIQLGTAGIMLWSVDQDDFTGKLCDDGKYPLMRSIKSAIDKEIGTSSTGNVDPDIFFLTENSSNWLMKSSGFLHYVLHISVLLNVTITRLIN